MKVSELNDKGYFPGSSKAKIVKSVDYDLDKYKSLILVTGGDFAEGQIRNINYFDEVIDIEELQSRIVKSGLADKVPSVTYDDKISIHNAQKHYARFIWFRFKVRGEERHKKYAQFMLIDPNSLEEIFVAEQHLDFMWSGVNDQSTWYPLFNSLIDYIKRNSTTYGKNT